MSALGVPHTNTTGLFAKAREERIARREQLQRKLSQDDAVKLYESEREKRPNGVRLSPELVDAKAAYEAYLQSLDAGRAHKQRARAAAREAKGKARARARKPVQRIPEPTQRQRILDEIDREALLMRSRGWGLGAC